MSQFVNTAADPAAARAIARDHLLSGGLVVLPTETVYGLAALPSKQNAIDAMFECKGRSTEHPVAVLVADIEQARILVMSSPAFDLLSNEFWPGPLTLVASRSKRFSARLGGDEATVGVRCPDHDFVRLLASEVGPLAVTSANRTGFPTEVEAHSVARALDGNMLVVDDGPCAGQPSTVVDVTIEPARLLRAGSIGRVDLVDVGLLLVED